MNQGAGIVLCGGQSTRMGQSKAWLDFAGEPMLVRIVRILHEVVAPIVVVASPGQSIPDLPAGTMIARDAKHGRGPLQGLCAGLEAVRAIADTVYLSSCDVPLLRPNFVRRMFNLLGDHHIATPDIGGFRHPLASVYRIEVLDVVRRLLAEDRLRPMFLFDEAPTRFVRAEELIDCDPDLQSLRNLNTREEYLTAIHGRSH